MIETIFKNSSYLIVANALTKGISFFYVIFMARVLGVSFFGTYIVALSYFSLLGALSDFGMGRYLTREIAKGEQDVKQIVSSVVTARVLITIIGFIIFSLFVYLFDSDIFRRTLTISTMIAVIPQSLALTFDSIFIALQKVRISALGIIFVNIITVVCGVYLITQGFGVSGAIFSLVFGQLLYAILLLQILTREKIISANFKNINTKIFSTNNIRKVVLKSLPYGVLTVLGLLYFKIDSIILSYIKGSFETGLYGAAYKFLEAIYFIPISVGVVLFPVFSKLHISNKDQLTKLYFTACFQLGVLSLAVSALFYLVLPTLIRQLLPGYISSIEAILILTLAIPFMFIHTPGVQILLSTDQYLKEIILFSLFTVGVNIILNLIFIPKFGFIAASWVTVFSEILSFVIFFGLIYFKILSRKKI